MRQCAKFPILVFSLASLGRLPAIDLTIHALPELSFPLFSLPDNANAGKKTYSLGGGIRVSAELEFLDYLYAGLEGSAALQPLNSQGDSSALASGGLGLGCVFSPVSRLRVQAGIGAGAYSFWSELFPGGYYGDFYARAQLAAGYRFSPTFSLYGNVGYLHEFQRWTPLYMGLSVGVSANLTLDMAQSRDEIVVEVSQAEPVFSVVYASYAAAPVGTIKLTNREKTEIRDVRVEFRSERYTSAPVLCGSASILAKGRSVEFPLLAGFNESILDFSEDGEIPGEISVSYTMLGAQRKAVKTQAIKVRNRNTVPGRDPAVLAALVSPNSTEILAYAKYVVGIARNQLRTGLNRNMQFAMALFEALRLSGVAWQEDGSTPYTEARKNPERPDYVQYPFQTLAYRSGDCDDIGVLYAACLESIGVGSAFVPLADDFLVCVDMGISAAEADRLFSSAKSYLAIDEEAWLPVSMSRLREGFVNAWYAALDGIGAATVESAQDWPDFIPLTDAWQEYPPLGVSSTGSDFLKPPDAQLARAVDNGLIRYISAELGPKIRDTLAAIKAQGGSVSKRNQLGLLYVRAGMFAEAKGEFEASAAAGSVPALINLGNVRLLEKDYAAAAESFKKALALTPNSKPAQDGLALAASGSEEQGAR
jgi:tetratricopeptide (TPR) repeat protein